MKIKTILTVSVVLAFLMSCEKKPVEQPVEKEVTLKPVSLKATDTVASPKDISLADLKIDKLDAAKDKVLPEKGSLEAVKLTEFIDFGCGYCYQFNPILADLKNTFRDRLQVETIIVSWRGENLPKFYYFAEKKGKGEEVKNMLFSMFHESNIKNLNNLDILQTVGEEIGLLKSSEKVEEMINQPDFLEKHKFGEEKIRNYKVSGTPTVVIEDTAIAKWDKQNLTNILTYLLK